MTLNKTALGQPASAAILYYAGTHDDDKDTLEAVKGLEEALQRLKIPVTKTAVNRENWQKAVKIPGDVVFNFVEDDTWELYLSVAERLEDLHRAQVGHDLSGLKYTIEKALIKKSLAKLGLSTPEFKIFKRKSKISDMGLKYPLIIKPSHQHAGIGISQRSVVTNFSELVKQVKYLLANFPGEVIAEEFIKGREIHVTILGNGKKVLVLPLCEIGFLGKFSDHWGIYTYEAKWDKKSWEYWDARVDAPAAIGAKLRTKIENLTKKAYQAFKCRDIARMDVRVSEHLEPFIVDVNMNPSLNFYDGQDATVASVYAQGWSYDKFIENLISLTYKRVYK